MTVKNPWNYKFKDLGLSVKWTDCNFFAQSPYDFGQYLPFGTCLKNWDSANKFSLEQYQKVQLNLNGYTNKNKWKSIILTESDPLYQFESRLRLPTFDEVNELIYECNWCVVFQYKEQEKFIKRVGPERYSPRYIRLEITANLQKEWAQKQEVLHFDEFDCLSSDIIELKKNIAPGSGEILYSIPHICEFIPYYLLAYKNDPLENVLIFPFSGTSEYNDSKHENEFYNRYKLGETETRWTVEFPFGDNTAKDAFHKIGIFEYSVDDVTLYTKDKLSEYIYSMPARPRIIESNKPWIGRNFRGVENIKR